MDPRTRSTALVLSAAVAAIGFHDLARRYDGFRLWDGPPSAYEPHPVEMTFFLCFIVLGGFAATCIALAAIDRADVSTALEDRLRRVARSPWLAPGACLAVLAGALVVRDLVLKGAPLSDDENVYAFIAKTLARGHLSNPPPPVGPADIGFFQSTFVVLDERGWFGKYPIGHPLLLAAGELVGARGVVSPLLATATAAVTYFLARRLAGPVAAAIALLLVAVSPQLVLSGATDISQNTSQLTMMLGLLAVDRAKDAEGGARTRELALGGLALGFGVLTRPVPGLMFVVAAAVQVLTGWRDVPIPLRLRALLAPAVVVAAFAAIFAVVNWKQTGHALVSGYQAVHGALPGAADEEGIFSGSLVGALVRQWVWAFGWPFSFVFVPFAARAGVRGDRSLSLLWLFLVAGYSYRLTTPKVFVGSTGPVYVAEMVPILAILSAVGMMRLRRLLIEVRPSWSRAVTGLAVGSTLACFALFLPFQLSWLSRLAASQRFTPDALAARDVRRALVFSTNTVEAGEGWALSPPPPPPDLDEPVVYVRRKRLTEANVAFWKRYFPDRAAFVLELQGGVRHLRPLAPGSERPIDPDARPFAASPWVTPARR